MEMIHEWLQGDRNYFVGRAIYNTVGSDQDLQQYFSNNSGPEALEKLIVAMTKLLQPTNAPQQVKKQPIAPAKAPVDEMTHYTPEAENQPKNAPSEITVMPESSDMVLKALRIQWLTPYKQMQHLISRLDSYGQSNIPQAIEARSSLAERILVLEQECMRLWAQRDHYLVHGRLPDQGDELEVPTDPIELAAMINRIKNNIRQSRKRMNDNPDNPTAAAAYLKYKEDYKKVTGQPYPEKL